MTSNLQIRFQIIRNTNDNPVELSGTLYSIFNSAFAQVCAQIYSDESEIESELNNPINLFEYFANRENIIAQTLFGDVDMAQSLQEFMNETLYEDQVKSDTATSDMIKDLGPYKRVKNDDILLNECCTICCENYYKNEGIRKLNCGHTFHKKCIDKWLKIGSIYCPICRGNSF